ncbi:hypothetical protein TNCV_1274461 [Trichonephila clavipes]|nr:hypothetical protein TNCV_1274461 [Trichonephila clavipes]
MGFRSGRTRWPYETLNTRYLDNPEQRVFDDIPDNPEQRVFNGPIRSHVALSSIKTNLSPTALTERRT